MSVMTAEDFADICEKIWGENWRRRAAARLDYSDRQLRRVESGEHNVSRRLRDELLAVVREQKMLLDDYLSEFS